VEQERLKLVEFRTLYKAWKIGVPWLDHLLLGLLVWFEQKLLDNRVKVEVDEAIKEWETLQPTDIVSPVYEENLDNGVVGLPEMRLTAPWLKNDKNF
jgi:hypothetical protein